MRRGARRTRVASLAVGGRAPSPAAAGWHIRWLHGLASPPTLPKPPPLLCLGLPACPLCIPFLLIGTAHLCPWCYCVVRSTTLLLPRGLPAAACRGIAGR